MLKMSWLWRTDSKTKYFCHNVNLDPFLSELHLIHSINVKTLWRPHVCFYAIYTPFQNVVTLCFFGSKMINLFVSYNSTVWVISKPVHQITHCLDTKLSIFFKNDGLFEVHKWKRSGFRNSKGSAYFIVCDQIFYELLSNHGKDCNNTIFKCKS